VILPEAYHLVGFGEYHHQEEREMRREFIAVTTKREARKLAPWAAIITKCEGGYQAFESVDDYRTWKNQV